MARDFLRKIAHLPLPIEIRQPGDMRSVSVLRAAGMLEAIVPSEPFDDKSTSTVLRITPLGYAELERPDED